MMCERFSDYPDASLVNLGTGEVNSMGANCEECSADFLGECVSEFMTLSTH